MKGQEAFFQFYQEVYGQRWQALLSALQESETQVIRVNLWNQNSPHSFKVTQNFDGLNDCQKFLGEKLERDPQTELLPFYVMDPASVIVARHLVIPEDAIVLDMCAAPGGKALIISENPQVQKFICNEFSMNRRERLKKVLQQYIPRAKRDFIQVTGLDAARIGLKYKNYFNAILLDAPCSGERHLLQNKEELSNWSKKRTQGLAQKQYAMLCSALLAAQNNAQIVYSTCSISPFENDGVIEKLLHKKSDQFKILEIKSPHPLCEKTKYGYQFLPDKCHFGPMYFCVIQKISAE